MSAGQNIFIYAACGAACNNNDLHSFRWFTFNPLDDDVEETKIQFELMAHIRYALLLGEWSVELFSKLSIHILFLSFSTW